MYILLPPSEGKSVEPGRGSFRKACPECVAEVEAVIAYLHGLSESEKRSLYAIKSAEKAAEAHARNLAALDAPCLKAITRYTGVVYEHLDVASLSSPGTAYRRLLIVSSLFGLVGGGIPLPCYKLSMTPWLAKFWNPVNSERLATMARGKPVLNLLSQGYTRAVSYPNLINVDFRVEGGRKAAGHFGKAVKGRFVRWILENGIKNSRDFHDFREDGYEFDGTNFIQRSSRVRSG